VSDQILAPVVVDHGYVLFQVQVLDHDDGQVIVTEAQHQLQHVLRLEFIELLVGDGAGTVGRVAQLGEDHERFHLLDVLVRVEGARGLGEGLREGGRTQQVLHHWDVRVLACRRLQQVLDARYQILTQVVYDIISSGLVKID